MAIIPEETLAAARILVFIEMMVLIASGLGSLLGLKYAYPVFQWVLAALFLSLVYLAARSWQANH
jgi:hypothetical protein